MPKKTRDTKLSQREKFVWFKDGKQWAFAAQEDWGQLGKKKISIDIPGENKYKITGDNMSWEFEIFKGDEKVVSISKKWGIIDNYGVRVVDGVREVDILLCGILADAVYHGGVSYH